MFYTHFDSDDRLWLLMAENFLSVDAALALFLPTSIFSKPPTNHFEKLNPHSRGISAKMILGIYIFTEL